jgi:hypothetical protein
MSKTDFRTLARICERFHGSRGRFAYAAFTWANENLYDGLLPVPLIQWALTPYGACIAMTGSSQWAEPVITLHPSVWESGPLETLDTMIHELMHVHIRWVLRETCRGTSSHDNTVWVREILHVSKRLGLPPFKASRTVRKRDGARLLRVMPSDCISRKELADWPSSLRSQGYYRAAQLPFSW